MTKSRYIVHARCVWYDKGFGAPTISNPNFVVIAESKQEAEKKALQEARKSESKMHRLDGFKAELINFLGEAEEEPGYGGERRATV